MRVLITGGSGFIGTNLIESLLQDGEEILNVDCRHPLNLEHNCCWRNTDILDYDSIGNIFAEFRPTHVVHLAARTDIEEKTSIDGYAVNIQGTENILKACAATDFVERVIITSSMLVCRLGYLPQTDEDYSPPNLYGESKVLTEKITRDFGLACTWIIIRPTTIWGPWSERYRDEFFKVLRKGLYVHPAKKKILKTYGYVGNAVFQIRRLLVVPEAMVHKKTFYIGDPPIDLLDWVNSFSMKLCAREVRIIPVSAMHLLAFIGDVISKCGLRFPFTTFRLRNMTTENILDVESTGNVTGKLPYSLEDGVDLTVKWLKNSQKGMNL